MKGSSEGDCIDWVSEVASIMNRLSEIDLDEFAQIIKIVSVNRENKW